MDWEAAVLRVMWEAVESEVMGKLLVAAQELFKVPEKEAQATLKAAESLGKQWYAVYMQVDKPPVWFILIIASLYYIINLVSLLLLG